MLLQLEEAERSLLVDMQCLASDWRNGFLKKRWLDLVLQRQGYSKLLWRLRAGVSGSQRYIDLFGSDVVAHLPESVIDVARRFEQPRLLLNARMRSASASRQAIDNYLESMRQLRTNPALSKTGVL